MISKDIASNIAEKHKVSKTAAKEFVDDVFDEISKALATGEKVTLLGVGSLNPYTRKPRTGRNPSTGEKLEIPAKKDVKFKMATALKERL